MRYVPDHGSRTTKAGVDYGAKGNLGTAVVKKFLDNGYSVTGTQREAGGALSPCRMISVDLTDPKAVARAFKESEYDVLVHCAGGFRFAKIDQVKDEDLDFLINTNLRSAFYLVRELLPRMKQRDFGRIIFVSSRATLQSSPGMGAYAASKAGLNLLTSTLAAEVRSLNVTVNAVLPTIIDTPPNRKEMPNTDFSEWVRPEQLAEIIYSLASPWGDAINGALIPVAGRL